MKKKWKRLLSVLLTAVMLVTVLPTQAFASLSATWNNSQAENQEILAQLAAITGSQAEARALYARLDALGVLGEGGWVTEELVINGESYTLAEAVTFVNTLDDAALVTVGDTSITAGALKTMLAIEQEISRIRQLYFYNEGWTDEQLAMLADLENALNSGDFTVSSEADGAAPGGESALPPSGVDHSARVEMTSDGNGTFTATLAGGTADRPVTFEWEALSGSQRVSGTTHGTVTLTPNNPTAEISVTVDQMTEGDVRSTADLVWYLKLDGLENALFTNDRSAMTMEVREKPTMDAIPGAFSYTLKVPEWPGEDAPAFTFTAIEKQAINEGYVDQYVIQTEEASLRNDPDGLGGYAGNPLEGTFEKATQLADSSGPVTFSTTKVSIEVSSDTSYYCYANYGWKTSFGSSHQVYPTTLILDCFSYQNNISGKMFGEVKPEDWGDSVTLDTASAEYGTYILESLGIAPDSGYLLSHVNTLSGNPAITISFLDTIKPEVEDVTAPAGAYYSGQIVPVTVTFSEPVTNVSAVINGEEITLSSIEESDVVVFPYEVKGNDGNQVTVSSIDAQDISGNPLPEQGATTLADVTLVSMEPGQSVESLTSDLAENTAIPATGGEVTFTAQLREGYQDVFLSQGYSLYLSTDGGSTVHKMETTDQNPNLYATTIIFPANAGKTETAHYAELYLGLPESEGGRNKLYFGHWLRLPQAAAKYITADDLSIQALNFPDEGVTIYPDSVENDLKVEMDLQGSDFTFMDPAKDFAWTVEVQKTVTDETTGETAVWVPDDGSVASVTENGTINLGGTSGIFRVALTAFNGGKDTTAEDGRVTVVGGADVTVYSSEVTVGIGSNPILMIAPSLQRIPIRSGDDAVVRWTSNLTQKQYEVLKEQGKSEEEAANAPFRFTVQVYRHKDLSYDFSPDSEPDFDTDLNWELRNTYTVESTQASTVSQFPVKGLAEPSAAGCYSYGIRVTASFNDAQGKEHAFDEFALVSVTSKPAVVTLDKPQLYYIEGDTARLSWTVENFDTINDAAFSLVITRNDDGEVVGVGNNTMLEKVGSGTYTGSYDLQFTAPTDFRDTYTVELRARNAPDSTWSYDSAVLYCFDNDAFQIYVDGEPVNSLTMDNVQRLGLDEYADNQALRNAIVAMKRDIPLLSSVQLNPNVAWGSVSDQVVWDMEGDAASFNYRRGTLYEDFRLFGYESFDPNSTFLLSGLSEGQVTLSAAHKLAEKVLSDQVKVAVETLRDKLYLFQVAPAANEDYVTVLEYTNGAGQVKQVYADETGAAVIYDPTGISSDVRIRSTVEGKTYLGTLYQSGLVSGEGDATKLALYPLNTVKLREAATLDLYLKGKDGAPLTNTELTINGGVYKNDGYCPDAHFSTNPEDHADLPGDGDGFEAKTDSSGKLTIYMDVSQFYTEDETPGEPLKASDKLTFRLIVQTTDKVYLPELIQRDGAMSWTETVRFGENVVSLRENTSKDSSGKAKAAPFVIQQEAELTDDYRADLIGFTGKVGPSSLYPKVTLVTDVVWWGEDGGKTAAFYDSKGTKAPGQKQTDLSYEFTDMRFTRLTLVLDGSTMEGWIPDLSTRTLDLNLYDSAETLLATMPQSFRVANMLKAKSPDEDPKAREAMWRLLTDLSKQLVNVTPSVEEIAGAVGDELLSVGLTLVAGTNLSIGSFLKLNLFATKDPTVFRGLFSVSFGDVANPVVLREGFETQYLSLLKNVASSNARAETWEELKAAAGMVSKGGKKHGLATYKEFGGFVESEIYYEDGQWHIHVLNGGLRAGFGAEYTWRHNSFVGYIPVTAEFTAGAAAAVEMNVGVDRLNDLNYYLTELRIAAYLRAFGGFGFDYSIIALKIGLFGNVDFKMTARWFNEQGDKTIYGNQNAQKLELSGQTGIEFYAALLFFSYRKALVSIPLVDETWYFSKGEWDSIEDDWAKVGQGISAVDSSIVGKSYANALYYDSRSGQTLYASPTVVTMESRDYLQRYDRVWNPGSGFMSRFALFGGGDSYPGTVLENAYPSAAPILSDDGKMLMFLNDDPNNVGVDVPLTDTRASYVLQSGDSFDNPKPIDGGEDTGYGDSQLAAAGSSEFAVAAWVRLNADPGKEADEMMSSNDQMAMLASTEVMASVWNGRSWDTTALTDNGNAPDLAPAVAVYEDKAIVAWRAVSATNEANPTRFDAGDSILYKTYTADDGWSDTKTLYNGTSGAVKGLEAAMMSDGTAGLIYSIDTNDRPLAGTQAQAQILSGQAADDNTGLEIVYAVVDDLSNGQIWNSSGETAAANVRLTYDQQLDENPQITVTKIDGKEHFILGWSRTTLETSSGDTANSTHDLALRAVDRSGKLRSDLPDSVTLMTSGDGVKITSKFTFSKGSEDINDLAILWVEPVTNSGEDDADAGDGALQADRDQLMAVKLVTYTDDGGHTAGYGLTAPLLVGEMPDYTLVDHVDARSVKNGLQALLVTSHYGTGEYTTVPAPDGEPLLGRTESGEVVEIQVPVPRADIRLLSSTYENQVSIDKIVYDQDSVMPGLALPVQMTVTNRGVDPITGITVTIGGTEVFATGSISLAPGQRLPLTVYYTLPSTAAQITDVDCVVAATFSGDAQPNTDSAKETLALSTPDVGISRLDLVDQVDGKRILQAILYNEGEVPLDSSRHTVKLALYSDSACTEEYRLVEPVTISDSDLEVINEGGYTTRLTFDLGTYVKETLEEDEVPEGGLTVYAKVWIEEKTTFSLTDLLGAPEEPALVEDTRMGNDIAAITVTGLLEQRENAPATLTSTLDNSGDNTVVSVTVQNNSLSQKTTGNLIVTLLDENGEVLEQLQSYTGQGGDQGFINLGPEERAERSFAFTQKGASVSMTYSDKLLEGDNAELDSLSFSNIPGVTLENFVQQPDGIYYYAVSTDDLTSTAVMASAKSAQASISLNGGAAGGSALSETAALTPGGTSDLVIVVTCGSKSETYILHVQNNGDPILENPEGTPGSDSGQYSASTFYAADEAVISLTATEQGQYSLTYQWYACDAKGENQQLLDGETASTLTIPNTTDVGVYYYRCQVTRHLLSGGTKTFWSSVASVQIKPAADNSVTLIGTTVPFDNQPHGLAGAQAAKAGSTLWFSTDAGVTWSQEQPAFTSVGVHTVWAYATNPNYEDTAVVTADVVIQEAAGTLYKLETQPVAEAFAGYPESIRTRYGDADGLEQALLAEITKLGIPEGSALVYDVKLLFSLDGGATWAEASADNFPAAGVTVKLPYPEGSDRFRYSYTLLHLITDPLQTGKTEGALEVMDITLDKDGIRFTADCLSPFVLGWSKRPTSVPERYAVAVQSSSNGSFTVKPTLAAPGETVTVTTQPDTGYEVECISITTRNGRQIPVEQTRENTYTFEMPRSAVLAQVTFRPVARWESPFADVAERAWYYDAVQYVSENGLMGGTAPDRFSPNLTTTRAMLITILYRMEGSPAMDDAVWGYPFQDVAHDAWYAAPVYWSRMTGVMTGYSDEVFGPDDPVTREQMAAILYRYAQYKGLDSTARADLSRYSDAGQISAWAKDAFSWVNARGIINGDGSALSPRSGATRAQAAQILMNYQNIR